MLANSFGIVAPIFALIAIGYVTVRTGLIGGSAGEGLSAFVFVLAIPALLFRTVATADLPNLNPAPYWLAYFIPLALVWLAASAFARLAGRDRAERAVIGFTAAQSNTVLIGIPLILGVFGEAGRVPIVLLLAVHLPVTMTIVTVLIERGGGAAATVKLIRSLVTHPILIGIFAGLAWRMTGQKLPEIPLSIVTFLSQSAAPCALVATGMGLVRVSFSGSRLLIMGVGALKLILHPLLVFLFAKHVFVLPPVWIGAATLFAACPSGINAFLVAERYRKAEAIASGTIALTTLIAVVTTTFVVSVVAAL
ncbi:MAG: AEC family transporter [Methylobacterium sp.]|nr:AEC family transporter [Methylobacterium sp.]MCA3597999.1 AEC family transporter [Methylobacterium sp.]MCA3599572.1 AEC family transporter [Methylobacterium sp.]MCA3604183.1 AEC family transporter [Methylobacterium sp.]MCA3606152.1 AEC family transporter [Methylobacterium sp.]